MATYFHGSSEIQAGTPDGLQTLVLMNPAGYIPYADTAPPPPPSSAAGNLFFLNSAAASLAHHHHHHNNNAPQHAFAAPNGADGLHHGFLPQRVLYNLWGPPPETPPGSRDTPRGSAAQQGLSLTLSSQQLGFGSPPGGQAHAQQPPPSSSGEDMRVSGGGSSSSVSVSGVTNGVPGIQSVLLSSKYLKAAQELLEEVVNVGGGIGAETPKKAGGESSGAAVSGEGSVAAGGGEGGSGKRAAELTPAERQEVQMKKAKLISMLDEVEQRYRQYHHQMQVVISSFEQAAGIGSARTYTALALQTISKQFRCLKDAITGQIRAASKSLGEEEGGKTEGSRLKFVDHHLRQQRALQQLGMIQQNAWRPQRGLPERSVSVLRAWLFEHFLHPYPKDSDKHMLAKQTGLTRSQVSNWFINARVRLWKPMVEEMYLEEVKEQEQNGGEKPNKSINDDSDSKSKDKSPASATTDSHAAANAASAGAVADHQQHQQYMLSPARNHHSSTGGFSLIGPSELDGIAQSSPKKPRCDGDVKPGKFGESDRQGRDGYSFMGGQANFVGGFGQYPIGEIEHFAPPRFSGSNGVSLTLGLPHHSQSFVPNQGIHHHHHHHGLGEARHEFIAAMNTSPHAHPHAASPASFDAINIPNPKRFAAQLLPDFVS